MGMGLWAQGELIRSIEKTERARWRRSIERAQARLWRKLDLWRVSNKKRLTPDDVRHEVVETFNDMRKSTAPKRMKPKAKLEELTRPRGGKGRNSKSQKVPTF